MSAIKIALTTTVASLAFLSTAASAFPLNDFGLVVLGDVDTKHLRVDGTTFIGGNLNGGNYEFGKEIARGSRDNSAQIGGAIKAQNLTAQAGYIATAGAASYQNLNCNGSGMQRACLTFGNDFTAQKAAIADALYENAGRIADMAANGIVDTRDHNRQSFSYTGSDAVAVFEIDGAALFARNGNWSLNPGAAETVIINVSGTDIRNSGGVNFNGFDATGSANILWNFYEAENVYLDSSRFTGAVLAPWASIYFGTEINGAVAARSLSGGGSVRGSGFAWTPPVPVFEAPALEPSTGPVIGAPLLPGAPAVAVPEPSAALMLLAGLGALGLARRRAARASN